MPMLLELWLPMLIPVSGAIGIPTVPTVTSDDEFIIEDEVPAGTISAGGPISRITVKLGVVCTIIDGADICWAPAVAGAAASMQAPSTASCVRMRGIRITAS